MFMLIVRRTRYVRKREQSRGRLESHERTKHIMRKQEKVILFIVPDGCCCVRGRRDCDLVQSLGVQSDYIAKLFIRLGTHSAYNITTL